MILYTQLKNDEWWVSLRGVTRKPYLYSMMHV